MEIILKVIFVSLAVTSTSCSFEGFSDMIPLYQRPYPNDATRRDAGDPCNSLYWYPRAIPEYCNQKNPPPPPPIYPMPPPLPPPPRAMIPMLVPPLPYGIPIIPASPMLPVGGLPLPAMAPYPGVFPAPPPSAFGPYAGLMPGFRGLSPAGGINIMPFSEAYASMLEDHRRKILTNHMERILKKRYGERVNYGKMLSR